MTEKISSSTPRSKEAEPMSQPSQAHSGCSCSRKGGSPTPTVTNVAPWLCFTSSTMGAASRRAGTSTRRVPRVQDLAQPRAVSTFIQASARAATIAKRSGSVTRP